MKAIAEKLEKAGYDTFAARFAVTATEALRRHPRSIADAWRYMGETFGFEYLRGLAEDMAGGKPSNPAPRQTDGTVFVPPQSRPVTPYRPREISKERAARRQKLLEVVRSKYKCYDGRWWSEVGVHELPAMARQGKEAAALLASLPANLPNDGRSLGDVLSAQSIDAAVERARA